jgi:hypothetical protein
VLDDGQLKLPPEALADPPPGKPITAHLHTQIGVRTFYRLEYALFITSEGRCRADEELRFLEAASGTPIRADLTVESTQ